MTIYDSVNTVLKRLDDYPSINGEQIWTRAEVELYLKDGYNAFCRQTKCLLDFFYPENIPPVGNYTARWELGYYQSGMIAHGILSYSGGLWERDYSQASGTGPINHTQPWEADYIETVFPAAVHAVPEDNVAVDRATFDLHQLEPEFTRFFEETDRSFQTVTGDPWRFSMDRDGMSRLRLVPAGTGNAETVEIREPFNPLRAYWTLDESSGTRIDSVGEAHLTDSTSAGSVTGKISDAAFFDDASSQFLTHAEQVTLDGSRGITVSAWINVRTGAPANATYFKNGAIYVSFVSLGTSNAGPLYVFFTIGNDAGETTSAGTLLAAYDTWYFIVGRYDPDTGKPSISVNGGVPTVGVALALGHPMVDVGYGGGSVYVGGVSPDFSKAYIDEVAVWNKVLTAAEIAYFYALNRPPFTFEQDGQYGLLRDVADTDGFGTWGPVGTWGVLREIPEHFPMGAQYGIPRRLYSDDANTRVEYFRLGKDWDDNGSELPERFLKHVEYYAQAKCLERDGPGQDLKLAGHFMDRFDTGVRRMVKRLGENKRAVVGQIGSPGRAPTVPALARLPWRYGRQIRRGY
jgi:hypothetical protein